MDIDTPVFPTSVALAQLEDEQKQLLDTIDNLRKHGVGRLVDLPQIVVVGDQSSGKSSVLEAISRVRFPVESGLCTRFATELVLRTEPRMRVDVRIQSEKPGQATGVHQFREVGEDKDGLAQIIEEAKKVMLEDDKGFSEDVLRVEVCGPKMPCLTLVDLPGFFPGRDKNQSSSDRDLVQRLAARYMSQKNSIVLAVVSARNRPVMQQVLTEVEKHDKTRERTLGIITKPDLLDEGSYDEDEFVNLANNREEELRLGWHVLRNRAQAETHFSDDERDEKEQSFFRERVWCSLPSKNRGVATLRKKLSGILLDHIRRNLPALITSIEKSMLEREEQLKQLGSPRNTPQEMRMHLGNIARQFERLCGEALDGNYTDDFFGDLYIDRQAKGLDAARVRKLRAVIRQLNRTFAHLLATRGSKEIIMYDGVQATRDNISKKHDVPDYLQSHLKEMAKLHTPREVSFNKKTAELQYLSTANQGNEFPGTSNDRVAVKLFREQSQPWAIFARYHIQVVCDVTRLFVEELIRHIAGPDDRTRLAILSDIADAFFEDKAAVLESKLQELLYHYRSGHPQPPDDEFQAVLSRRSCGANLHSSLNMLASWPELLSEEGLRTLRQKPEREKIDETSAEGLVFKAETYYEVCIPSSPFTSPLQNTKHTDTESYRCPYPISPIMSSSSPSRTAWYATYLGC